jgi:hypothetical protein
VKSSRQNLFLNPGQLVKIETKPPNLGRRRCSLKLRELAETAGLNDYGAVALAIKHC